jgi:Raf kinase inhibitor-like YbhB/YbcL family protein
MPRIIKSVEDGAPGAGRARRLSDLWPLIVAAGVLVVTQARCARGSPPSPEAKPATAANSASEAATAGTSMGNGPAAAFVLKSAAFESGGLIPEQFSCQGSDISPALSWTDPPAQTQSFALIVDDPDAPAGTWVHWVAFDLPGTLRGLSEGVPKQEEVPGGGRQGVNDFEKLGYGGPCPPPGKPHRYFFKVYALDAKLNLKAGATKKDVERAMSGHILSKAELVGRFGR